MGEPIVRYVVQPENTPPRGELEVLASVYRFLLDRHAEKAAYNTACPEPEGGTHQTKKVVDKRTER